MDDLNLPTDLGPAIASTRPYLIRGLHEWCTDNGYTPYLAVFVDGSVQVPPEYVKGGEIVLNVGYDATGGLTLGNEYIEFKARFGGVPRDIVVPVDHVLAIYARENGQGMAFPPPQPNADLRPALMGEGSITPPAAAAGLRLATETSTDAVSVTPDTDPEPRPSGRPFGSGRPALKRVK